MKTILQAIIGAVLGKLIAWLQAREDAKKQAAIVQNEKLAADQAQSAIQTGEQHVEQDRDQTEAATAAARVDAASADSVQSLNEDVDAAIARTRSEDQL